MKQIALAIIAKDETEDIDRIIRDYGCYFDEVVLGIDDQKIFLECKEKYEQLKRVKCFKYPDNYIEDGRIKDFSHKRNWLETKITTPYYFRLDTDDEIYSAENIKKIVEKALEDNISIVYCNYLYSRDDWGNVNAQHYRETIIKIDENLYWNKPIHENIVPKSTKDHRILLEKGIVVNHRASPQKLEKSFERNTKYLLEEYKKDKENTDPRTIAYLGRMLFAAGNHGKALPFLELHIKKSGWDEDRYQSWCQIAEIMRQKGNYDAAQGACFEALAERPNYPDAYFKLHDLYQEKEDWERAIYWAEEGLKKPVPKTFSLVDPSAYTWRPILSLSFCYFQKGDFERAKQLFDVAEKRVPTLAWVVKQKPLYEKAYDGQQYIKRIMWMVGFLKNKEEDKIKPLIHSIPSDLQENEIVIRLKNHYLEPRKWGKKEIAIYCGYTSEQWSPKSVKTGVGGSEEAVIHLTKELNNLGYKVKVFNACYELEGNYDGVEYINFHKFNPNDEFNILIGWRANIFPYVKKVRQRIIWLHDLPKNMELNKVTSELFDNIIVLSQYHKQFLSDEIPKEKIFVSSNGINPDDFKKLDIIERKPHRIIYASSYDRGLEHLLVNWKKIRKEVPDAELHLFYGWQVYDSFVKAGYVRDTGWKNKMLELMKQEGITEHGRVGHKQLLKEYTKSGVYAYPCTYEGEIQCIALTKAIACGCNVVTNKYAVMAERSPNAVDDKEFVQAVIDELKKDNKKKTNWDYINQNSWHKIGRDWSEKLFKK